VLADIGFVGAKNLHPRRFQPAHAVRISAASLQTWYIPPGGRDRARRWRRVST
jgi:hypothetical protein